MLPASGCKAACHRWLAPPPHNADTVVFTVQLAVDLDRLPTVVSLSSCLPHSLVLTIIDPSRLLALQVTTKLQGKAGDVVNRVAALTLDAIDGPMQQLINGLVDDLESSATAAAFREIRQKMLEYKLISAEADLT
jgi:hypothetical protein